MFEYIQSFSTVVKKERKNARHGRENNPLCKKRLEKKIFHLSSPTEEMSKEYLQRNRIFILKKE